MAQKRRRLKKIVLLALTASLAANMAAHAWALPAESPQATAGANGRVNAIVQVGDTIYIGGEFSEVGGQPRSRLAAIDATTGAVTPWDPSADGNVYAMTAGPDGSIYAGGSFKTVSGQTRKELVRFDGPSGTLNTTWRPKATGGAVKTLALGNGLLYVGGSFTKVQATVRNRVAAVDLVTGALQSWNPDANGTVEALGVAPDGAVFAGGFYSSIGGNARQYLARLDGTTGLFTTFPASSIRYPVTELVLDDGNLYLAGAGTGGTVAAHSATTGALLWSRHTTGDVHAIDVSSTVVYAGGHFNYVEGVYRKKLVAFDRSSGASAAWNATTNGPFGLAVIEVTGSAVMVGGEFTKAGGASQQNFARFVGTP